MDIPAPQLTGNLLRHLLLSHALETSSSAATSVEHSAQRTHSVYSVLGRIIHKRKLSKKLFFFDVAFVQPKLQQSADQHLSASALPVESTPSQPEGLRLSHWHDAQYEGDQGLQDDHAPSIAEPKKVEIIAKVPEHTLKELDTLWHSVQLGAVVKVTGPMEISERRIKHSTSKHGMSEEQTISEKNRTVDKQKDSEKQWVAILHCLTIENIEPWQGKDTFQPIPGSAEIHLSQTKHGQDRHQESKGQKRTAIEAGLTTASADRGAAVTNDDHDVPPREHCKFWLNSGKCNKENCDQWHENDIVKLKSARRKWVEERIQAKRQISHHADDPHRTTTKNQHRERSLHFAKWLIDTFSRERLASGAGVLDIAGGRGDLSFELQTRQGIRSTIIDPKPDKGFRKWQRRWVSEFKKRTVRMEQQEHLSNIASDGSVSITHEKTEPAVSQCTAIADLPEKEKHEKKKEEKEEEEEEGARMEKAFESFVPTRHEYPLQTTEPARIQAMMDDALVESRKPLFENASILVGLHPDQATEHIVRMALRLEIPFAVIPCCVFSRDNPHRRLPRPQEELTICNPDNGESKQKNEGDVEDDESTKPVTSYDEFVQWLITLHPKIETTWLNFEGMNRVVYWRGPTLEKGSDIAHH